MIPAENLLSEGEITKEEYKKIKEYEESERLKHSFFSDSPENIVHESQEIECGSVYFESGDYRCDIDADKDDGTIRIKITTKQFKKILDEIFTSIKDAFDTIINGKQIREAIKGNRIYREPFAFA